MDSLDRTIGHGLIGYDRRTNFSPTLHALRCDLLRAMVNLPEKAPTKGEAPGTGAMTTPTTQAELRKNALCKQASGTEGMETTIAKAGAASSPDHTASFPPTTPFVCTLACYACTDPGSTAPTHAYSWDPEASGIYMHPSCFLDFTAWVETQTNLRDILHAWLLCSRRAHSRRSMKALKHVHRWQREKRMEWADTMRTRSHCRIPFTLWAREVFPIPLPLIDSSSDDDLPTLIDYDSSSSDSSSSDSYSFSSDDSCKW